MLELVDGSQGFNHPNTSIWSRGRFFGIVLIGMGLVVLLTPLFVKVETQALQIGLVAGIPLVIGFFLVSTFTGTHIDFRNNRFKKYQSVLWFRFGDWQELPKISKAEIVHHTFLKRNVPNGISPTLSLQVTVYKCVLLSEDAKLLVLEFTREKNAILALEKIKVGLGI
ncbi:hypothetical protein [Algoriphagus sp. NG3]|uniref:hypothetical protein n=1 Tax=unclassified Algoriphagus TaxID=2641541 RepID=UPI002A81EEBC|nr:hypothetical protein [Algoriphagus sp. NG3]WPR74932.1 hypothetical protein SLW71_19920 [Algoriphagus sp. NG3]